MIFRLDVAWMKRYAWWMHSSFWRTVKFACQLAKGDEGMKATPKELPPT
jgi:hypothetical protein